MESLSTESGQPANAAATGRVVPDAPSESVSPGNTPNTRNESNPSSPGPDGPPKARGDSRRFYTASLLGFFAQLPPLPRARPDPERLT